MARILCLGLLFIALLALGAAFNIGSLGRVRLARPVELSMKVFDWQRREAFQSFTIPDGEFVCFVDGRLGDSAFSADINLRYGKRSVLFYFIFPSSFPLSSLLKT